MANLRAALYAVRAEYGEVTPANVVTAARDESSPLHSWFEWDDAVAAEKHRLAQAGQLIRSFKIKFGDPEKAPKSVREWVSVSRPSDDEEEEPSSEYVPASEALADPLTRQILLRDMEREWKQFKARYAHMTEFADLIQQSLKDEAA